MTAKLIEIIVMEGIALLLFVFAYAIGVKKKMYLIAGYNEKSAHRVHNKDGLARLIGRVCLLVGMASALMPVATTFWGAKPVHMASWTGGYGGFIVGVIALTMLQAGEFTSPNTKEK